MDYEDVRAVDSLDVCVAPGEMLALLGPSGSGKSTLLYAIAGLVAVSTGSIELDGLLASTPQHTTPPERRPVGLVFQNYALWPHMTAETTVAYPLRRSGMRRPAAMARAHELLDSVGVGELAQRKPAALSGGQQQRVGLARALARTAILYLFDEPTAHLDATVRAAVLEQIARRCRSTGAGGVYATHDSGEALAISDRVAIMRDGAIVQLGSPREVYERPADVWAAQLTGPAGVLPVVSVRSEVGHVVVDVAGQEVVAAAGSDACAQPTAMLVRPEWVTLGGPIPGVVRDVWFRGPHTDYVIETSAGELPVRLPGPPQVARGATRTWSIERGWLP